MATLPTTMCSHIRTAKAAIRCLRIRTKGKNVPNSHEKLMLQPKHQFAHLSFPPNALRFSMEISFCLHVVFAAMIWFALVFPANSCHRCHTLLAQ